MSSDPGGDARLIVERLSKRYRVSHSDSRRKEDFWALRDVSFEVGSGEVLGVVGRNGAGKSTLLKILSRITQPTEGRAVLTGRLAGLLEVGTGFHAELTGRENIFLNGTMLGMTRKEIRRSFDDIVEFAGVGFFLDTPVKRYSSGMYVRLAFAVAAHLRADIMVLDEVLAVGDAAFQRKCLEKVHDLAAGQGRTVLIVSHNMEVVREHATRAILLRDGRLEVSGSVTEVLKAYEVADRPFEAEVAEAPRVDPNWGRVARLRWVSVQNGGRVPMYGDLVYDVEMDLREGIEVGVGQCVTSLEDKPIATSFGPVARYGPGRVRVQVRVPRIALGPGEYAMNVVIGRSSFSEPDLHYDGVMRAVGFEVVQPEGPQLVDWHPEWWGAVALGRPEVAVTEEWSAS